MSEKPILKLCPFCNGEPRLVINENDFTFVICSKCLCGTFKHHFYGKEIEKKQIHLATEAWNNRYD